MFEGSCSCGQVKMIILAPPVRAPVCHCVGCQKLHGAPFVWSLCIRKKDFRFVVGEDGDAMDKIIAVNPSLAHIYPARSYANSSCIPFAKHLSCRDCGGRLADEGEKYFYTFPGLFHNFASKTEDIPSSFRPSHHCFYGSRQVDILDDDDVPKFHEKWGSQLWTHEDEEKEKKTSPMIRGTIVLGGKKQKTNKTEN